VQNFVQVKRSFMLPVPAWVYGEKSQEAVLLSSVPHTDQSAKFLSRY